MATGPSVGQAEAELSHGRGLSTQSLLRSSSEDTQHVVRLGQCWPTKGWGGMGTGKGRDLGDRGQSLQVVSSPGPQWTLGERN